MVNNFIKIDSRNVSWRPSSFADKIWIKDLGEADGYAMQLVKFEPGAIFPSHLHTKAEFIYILEGVLIQDTKELARGFASIAPPGSKDMDVKTEHGCIFLMIG